MAEILHQLIGSLSHHFQGFIHPTWCKISAKSTVVTSKGLPIKGPEFRFWESQQLEINSWNPKNGDLEDEFFFQKGDVQVSFRTKKTLFFMFFSLISFGQ